MDKFKDQDSMLPAATNDKKKAVVVKTGGKTQVIINPPEKVDPQRGYQERFKHALEKHSVIIEKKTELVLQSKAARADIPQETLEQVFKRGYKTLPLNTELTREQYAMNRVNSFVAGGAAMVEDCDLLPIVERVHATFGMKGTGGAARPHIKREKSVYNGKTLFHVVDAKGHIKHSTNDEFEAKKHLATKYNSYMEGTLSPMKRFEGTKSLVKTYKDDTPGEGKKDVAEGNMPQSVIKSKQKYADMSDQEFHAAHQNKSEEELKSMAWRHGYGKGSSHYVAKHKKGQSTMAEAKDPSEYDKEGEMAKGQLRTIIANAQRAHDMLEDDTNMAEWVQSKITLASDYISTVADYIQSELKEGKMSDLDIDMQTMKDKDFETHYGKPKREYKPKLKGNQGRLDKNNSGHLDKEDFRLLRQEEIEGVEEAHIASPLNAANANAEYKRQPSNTLKVDVKHLGGVSNHKAIKQHLVSKGITAGVGSSDNYHTVHLSNINHSHGEVKQKLGIKEEVKKGLYYYVNRRKKLSISRDKDHPKAPEPQDWVNAAKTAKEEVDLSELNKDTLHSYFNKADKQIDAKHKVLGPQIKAGDTKAANKTSAIIGKRMTGMDRAETRLNKEEVSLSELSNAVLARYKSKAGEQASAADKAGDFKKGNKRFSGIIKATNKQFDNDMRKEEKVVSGGYRDSTGKMHSPVTGSGVAKSNADKQKQIADVLKAHRERK